MARLLLTFLFGIAIASCTTEEAPGAGGGDSGGAAAQQPDGGTPDGNATDGDTPAEDFAAGYDDSDCNLQTVLDPDKAGAPGHLIKSERNPNGDSELAVLMRRFVDDLRDNKLLVQAGEKLRPMHDTHRMMRCAWPTVPSERDEGFDQRSQTYLTAVRAFEAAPTQDSYNAIVNTCVACHQVSCGGVIDFIESLRWN